MKDRKRSWGVWLADKREWATLPPRLCKPTPYNSDLNDAMIGVVRRLAAEGHRPELKQIPRDVLIEMKKGQI